MTSERDSELLDALAARSLTLAVAESLTGGLVQAALVDVPGASRVFRGGVVAYASDVKVSVLGVAESLLAARGPVDPLVARQMARGVAGLLGADLGLATTGVAGPGPQHGFGPGTVFVAAVLGEHERVVELVVEGDRRAVREGARDAVLDLGLALTTGREALPGTTVDGSTLGEL